MAESGSRIELEIEIETRELKVENKYLKSILDNLHKSIIVGEATLQIELKPPEDIKNEKSLIELTTNTGKIHKKFYELETELYYIHKKISQLTSMIVGDGKSEEQTQERTNKFTAIGRQPKHNPAKTFGQTEQSSKIDKDIELLTSVWRDMQENKIPEMTEKEENILRYQTDLEELRGKIMRLENENKNLKVELRQREEELNRKEIRIIELEEKANGKLKVELSQKEEELNQKEIKIIELEEKRNRGELPKRAQPHGQHHARQVIRIDPTDLNKKIQKQKEQIRALVTQDKITKQLSKGASDKLTHENTDITDLSDENRSTKHAEKISELYDNQYTDAFDEFKANRVADNDAVRFLLRILMETHQLCKKATQKRYQKLKNAISCFEISSLTDGKDKTDKTVINEELSIELQQDIKRIWRESSKSLLKKARSIIGNRVATQFDFPLLTMRKISVYMARCIDLCWMMNLQEKPMHMDSNVQLKDEHPYFDSEKFRSYTKTGQYVAFVVWPALYLFEGGVMLKKGIAQGSSVAEGLSDQDVSCVTPVGDQTS